MVTERGGGGALELEGEAREVAGDEAKAMECSGEARVALYRQGREVRRWHRRRRVSGAEDVCPRSRARGRRRGRERTRGRAHGDEAKLVDKRRRSRTP